MERARSGIIHCITNLYIVKSSKRYTLGICGPIAKHTLIRSVDEKCSPGLCSGSVLAASSYKGMDAYVHSS